MEWGSLVLSQEAARYAAESTDQEDEDDLQPHQSQLMNLALNCLQEAIHKQPDISERALLSQ